MAFQKRLVLFSIIFLSSSSLEAQTLNGNQQGVTTLEDQFNRFQRQGLNGGSRQHFDSGSNDFDANFQFNRAGGQDDDRNSRLGLTRDDQDLRQSFNRDLTLDQNSRQGFKLDSRARFNRIQNSRDRLNAVDNSRTGFNQNQNSRLGFNQNSRLGGNQNQNSRLGFSSAENSRRGFNQNQNSRLGFNSVENSRRGFNQNQNSRLGFNSVENNQVLRQGVNRQFGRNNNGVSVIGRSQISREGVNRANRGFNTVSRQRFDPNRSSQRQNRVLEQNLIRSLGSRSSTRGGNLNQDPSSNSFNYEVNDIESNNLFGHEEQRDGDRTNGFYFVLLPDGRRQEVTYRVDGDSGYVADVKYV